MDSEGLQTRVAEKAAAMFQKVHQTTPSIFNRAWWSGKVMEWCMKNPEFKVEMFRFVDVLPYLERSSSVARHLQEYFCRPEQDFPAALQWGISSISPESMAAQMAARGIKSNIVKMARQFITGATPKDALPNLKRIRKSGLAFTLDLLGEATLSWPEAEEYQKRYLDLLSTLQEHSPRWPALGGASNKLDWGASPKINLSLKPSTFNPRMHPANFQESIDRTKKMLRPIFRACMEKQAFINVDVEQYAFKDLTLALFKSLLDEDEFQDYPHAGVVIQTYLKDSEQDALDLLTWAKHRKHPVTVRLVKGAYWDYETVIARQQGWRVPVFEDKPSTDANFEHLTSLVLNNHDHLRLACASHNLRSLAFALEYAALLGIPQGEIEFQVLFGMAEPVRVALMEEKVPLRVYATVGELIPGMAYLVRRLLENTANESFLRRSYAEGISIEELSADPRRRIPDPMAEPPQEIDQAPFASEPHLNFSEPKPRTAFTRAVKQHRSQTPREYPLFIDGQWIKTKKKLPSINPARPDEVVGQVYQAGKREVEKAFAAAQAALPVWRDTPFSKRAEILFKAADLARQKRLELAALQISEVGKAWAQADGDVTEAIDFLDYYAREAMRLGRGHGLVSPPGEKNTYFYQPRGIAVVIAPWNFPLAISMGMTSAALAAGNPVLYKPARDSQVVGAGLAEIFDQAGLPPGVLAYLPGPGSTVGRQMVDDPRTSLIAFTGSKEVGIEISQRAAQIQPGQRHMKKVIAELGGKNAIIVDSDADLDEAVAGICASAFGYQGQKCSACSRVLVLEENYKRFIDRLIPAAQSWVMGDPADPATDIGPMVDQAAQKKVLSYIELGKKEANLLWQSTPPKEGFYAPMAIFDRVPPESRLATEEIFGPVLSILKVKDMDEALFLALDVDYALTGGIYSRSPNNIERAIREFRVGNLYINRGVTGSMVGRQPFGGFALSGIGSKSGGPDYLIQFLEPRCVTENTLRRGFAPEG